MPATPLYRARSLPSDLNDAAGLLRNRLPGKRPLDDTRTRPAPDPVTARLPALRLSANPLRPPPPSPLEVRLNSFRMRLSHFRMRIKQRHQGDHQAPTPAYIPLDHDFAFIIECVDPAEDDYLRRGFTSRRCRGRMCIIFELNSSRISALSELLGHETHDVRTPFKAMAEQLRTKGSKEADRQWSAVYQPLVHKDSIRLLRLEPCTNVDDPIRCTIFNSRLKADTPYIALSYEWGSEDKAHDPTILINDAHHLRIRKNLYEALKEIRASAEFSSKPLWIDAICINQQKAQGEKPHQVRLMGKIFGQAALVIAWLGAARNDSDMAIDALKACGQYGCVPSPKHRCFITSVLQPPEPDRPLEDHPPWTTMKAIVALCNRPYWRRVWIMQEIHLSRSLVVRCGSQSITGTELEQAFDALRSFECIPYMRYKQNSLKRYYRDLTEFLCIMAASVPLRHLRARNHIHRSIGQLLQICVDANFRSTERRDYVFALLGISNDVAVGDIEVDYDKPLWLWREEVLPVIKGSYCSINEENRKSWDSFSQEFDLLLGYSSNYPPIMHEDEGLSTAAWLLRQARALPRSLNVGKIPDKWKFRKYLVQLGSSDYKALRYEVYHSRERYPGGFIIWNEGWKDTEEDTENEFFTAAWLNAILEDLKISRKRKRDREILGSPSFAHFIAKVTNNSPT